jgi:hypothetical protein
MRHALVVPQSLQEFVMTLPRCARQAFLAAAFLVVAASPAAATNIVLNGSLEDLNGSFANTACGYMALGSGSTAIANWTVNASTIGQMVWGASPTCDGFSASEGDFFADLSGFGSDSPNGTLEQQLATGIGQTYFFSIDLGTANGGGVSVVVGADLLTLSAGSPFVVGSTSWTPYTGSFIASMSNPLLSIANTSGNASIVFVDNVSITAQSVPDPASSAALFGFGIAAVSVLRRRVR